MNREELLLNAWIEMEVNIRGNRLLNHLSFNEMIILGTIVNGENVTASNLCSKHNMLKSQVNRLIGQLMEKGIVTKEVSATDRRKSYLTLTEKGQAFYLKEHENVVSIVGSIVDKLGEEKTDQLTALMFEAVNSIKGE